MSQSTSAADAPILGVFGGSFNPPHLSHVLALAVVLARFEVERLLVVPTYRHPFAKSLAPYDDRVKMCELAMGWLPKVEVSRVEERLGGESRTLRTIEHLRAEHPQSALRFIMGADLMVESSKWYGFDRIAALAPPIVLGRVGVEYPGAPAPVLPSISSTEVRTALADPASDFRIARRARSEGRARLRARAPALREEGLSMKVFILGAGKVGRALAAALKKTGATVTLRPARKGVPTTRIDASVIILALRDRQLGPVAADLATSGVVPRSAVVVHNAGALPADVLAPLRGACAGVAQMHPMISFASLSKFPTLGRGNVHVKGDPVAEKRARSLAKSLGMTPRTFAKLDTVGYHAAAGLVANGAAALAAVGVELLVVSGVPRAEAPKLLGPLLRSVAENVEALGFPDALTGPVRRGDAGAIERQLALLAERLPAALPLFIASGLAQLPIAERIGDAPKDQLREVGVVLERALRSKRRPRETS